MTPVARPRFEPRVPDGDSRERQVCLICGHIDYHYPKIIVGSVVSHADQVLLCRRSIEPRLGFWALPAGFLELGETAEQAARREAMEEACADIVLDGLLGVFSIAHLGHVQLIFRAGFVAMPTFAAGAESAEVALFSWAKVPWEYIAFPSVGWALSAWREAPVRPLGAPVGVPLEAGPTLAAPAGMIAMTGL